MSLFSPRRSTGAFHVAYLHLLLHWHLISTSPFPSSQTFSPPLHIHLDILSALLPLLHRARHRLARLLNHLEDLCILETRTRRHARALRLERHFIRADTYMSIALASSSSHTHKQQKSLHVPSSFFSTRSTAPEHPSQDMLIWKTYVVSPATEPASAAAGVGVAATSVGAAEDMVMRCNVVLSVL